LESIGEKFRALREERGVSIRQVCDETNISPTYLEALENEDFDKFPGETYITGFIRSYAEYLRIEPEELIKAYRGYKIGESVTPLEELTRPTGPSFRLDFSKYSQQFFMAAAFLVIAALLIGGFFVVSKLISETIDFSRDDSIDQIKSDHEKTQKDKPEFEQVRNLKLSNGKGFALVYKNEAVQFLVDSKECIFMVEDVSEGQTAIMTMPDKSKHQLELDRALLVPFNGISREVYLTLRGHTENRAKIMVTLGSQTASAAAEEEIVEEASPDEALEVSTQVRATDQSNLKIVFEALFMSKTYLEVYLDGQKKTQGIIQAGTREEWEANEYIQIKVGNAGGMKAVINGQEYVFGLAGEVANKTISWKRDTEDPNLYHIAVTDW
jgi:cytoskeleton protein RodZ